MGDALITKDGELIIPPTWLPETDTVADAQKRLAPLVELPVELVLTTHGEPVRENGEEALRKALNRIVHVRTTPEIREGFLRYFEEKGHLRLPSAPLIPPPDDPTTLLISAGMPLKPYFLGLKEPPATLLTTYQKCFRATDIEEVGLDGYHLSFFEMMGNFSIGQYFKEGAVELAWEFLFERLKIDEDRPG